MVIAHFLKWIGTALVSERAAAANALARAFVNSELPFEERCSAEAALTFLLDDPSAKVRRALAEGLSLSPQAPAQIIAALAADQPEVACFVIARSPLLTDSDLIDRVASGSGSTQALIAARPRVSMALSAAIAEVGEAQACEALLHNSGAEIAALSFRRIAERHGHLPVLREAMISDARLPSDCRHMLLVKVGEALKRAPLVTAMMGPAHADRVTRDACIKASITLIENTKPSEHAALVEHMRLRGDLTASFLIRTVAHGKIDFFGSAMVALTEHDEHRVKALLGEGNDVAVCALLRKAGLPGGMHAIVLRALKVWREVARGKRLAGAQEVSFLMMRELRGDQANGDLATLIKSIHLDALRENARVHAMAIVAA